MTGDLPQEESALPSRASAALRWVGVFFLIYGLLVAVATIASGFRMAAGEQARELFAFGVNPVSGLVVGTFAAALIQSSSTVTSVIVGLVAGGLPLGVAVPMVMGANMGTTLTNTVVSLGHVRNGEEFKRAFAAATIHDFFNVLAVVLFFPLELLFHPLERLSGFEAEALVGLVSSGGEGWNPIRLATEPLVDGLRRALALFLPVIAAGVVMVVIGVGAIMFVVTAVGRLLKQLLVGRVRTLFHRALGRGPVSGIASGTLITVLVQSSSTTTSLVIPLAATGILTLRQVYPFTLGANIGTCITAILAATAITGPMATVAMQIALVHFHYNLLSVLVIYTVAPLRHLPVVCAERLANLTTSSKWYAAAWVGGAFFLLPGAILAAGRWLF